MSNILFKSLITEGSSIMLPVQRRVQSTTHIRAEINLQIGKPVYNQLHATEHNYFTFLWTIISFLQLTEL